MDYNTEDSIITLEGKYVTVNMVNPYKCRFLAHYKDGLIIKGNNLLDTGWKDLPDGITKIQYELSNGLLVNIPNNFKSYLHLVDASQSLFGTRMFHNVFIKGETEDGTIVSYQIVLRESEKSSNKIGDILVSKDPIKLESPHWKSAER